VKGEQTASFFILHWIHQKRGKILGKLFSTLMYIHWHYMNFISIQSLIYPEIILLATYILF